MQISINNEAYVTPSLKELTLSSNKLICASPAAGAIEQIGYDNWTL